MARPVPPARALVLVDGGSPRGTRGYTPAFAAIEASGVEVVHSQLVHDPDRIPDAVSAAVEGGCSLLVVGGGDGTVSKVAGLIADLPPAARPVLGVLPLGTANDFARTLDLPSGWQQAIAVLRSGKVVDRKSVV